MPSRTQHPAALIGRLAHGSSVALLSVLLEKRLRLGLPSGGEVLQLRTVEMTC